MDNKDDDIQWVCNTSISAYTGEPETLKEAMPRPNGYLRNISAISEVKTFLSRKAWILRKRSVLKAKVRKPVPVNWLFKSKKEAYGLILRHPTILVKGYMQVPGVDFVE